MEKKNIYSLVAFALLLMGATGFPALIDYGYIENEEFGMLLSIMSWILCFIFYLLSVGAENKVSENKPIQA